MSGIPGIHFDPDQDEAVPEDECMWNTLQSVEHNGVVKATIWCEHIVLKQ